jgi:aminopeptidase N
MDQESLIERQLKQMQKDLGYTPFADPKTNEKSDLTTSEAVDRASVISKVEYTLTLVLHKGVEYLGYLKADFELSQSSEKLFFDFHGKEILSCTANNENISPKDIFCQRRIKLPAKHLKVGHNIITIAFRNLYATDGNGLHHFVDPEDKEEYLYSNFEPFAANKMFPCFDQPNLKAILKLITVSPSHWQVIANELEKVSLSGSKAASKLEEHKIPLVFVTKDLEEYSVKEFAPTPPISTYLFACVAGPYDFFTSTRRPEEGYPPMRIFVRKSLKKYVEPYYAEFFKITECGTKFYEDIFGRKHPFSKHDQVYCPEYNVGAMENVGLVTYTETYVFKDPPTEERMMDFAETILHELSHMWFGDLVTMNWWNDLWLNESFATFISNLAMAKAPGLERYRAVWIGFNKSKGWAYRVDQEPTTHPITAKVESTEDAENIFDGITYMKGASVLKQFYYLVSHDVFCDGLKEYFQTYQWKNTELKDFIGVMQKALKASGSKIDLDQWVKEWLKTKGLNELEPEITINNNKIEEFKVVQQFAPHADQVCRMHMMDVVLYDAEFKEKVVERVLIDSKPETKLEVFKGMPEPTAILLNINDYAFAKIRLDEKSLHAFQKNLNKVNDSLTRMIIWRSFWDMVLDGMTSPKEYINLVLAQLPAEKNEIIITGALLYSFSAISNYIPKEHKKAESSLLFDMALERLKSETSNNTKKSVLNYIIQFACKMEHKKMLIQWLKEGTGIAEAVLTQGNRYSILTKIYADKDFTLEEKQKLLESELEKDKSDEGMRARRKCEAAIPTVENKEKCWKSFLDEETKESDHMLFSGMAGFNSDDQEELLKPYLEKYFDVLADMFKKRSRAYAGEFFVGLRPLDDDEVLKRFEEMKDKLTDETKTLQKMILEEINNLKRCIRGKAKYIECLKGQKE